MIDFDILKEAGTTNERLRKILTCTDTENPDHKIREKIEDMVSSRMTEHVTYSLKNHQLYSAVDMACQPDQQDHNASGAVREAHRHEVMRQST